MHGNVENDITTDIVRSRSEVDEQPARKMGVLPIVSWFQKVGDFFAFGAKHSLRGKEKVAKLRKFEQKQSADTIGARHAAPDFEVTIISAENFFGDLLAEEFESPSPGERCDVGTMRMFKKQQITDTVDEMQAVSDFEVPIMSTEKFFGDLPPEEAKSAKSGAPRGAQSMLLFEQQQIADAVDEKQVAPDFEVAIMSDDMFFDDLQPEEGEIAKAGAREAPVRYCSSTATSG